MFTISYGTIREAGQIADLSRKTFFETFSHDNSPEDMNKFMNEQFTREMLVQEVGAPGNIFLLARDGEEIIGYARLRENNIPPALRAGRAIEIARLYASGLHIGKGVGSALMKKCIQLASERNYPILWLGVWEHNHRAIAFYIRWGFKKFSEQDFILGNDIQKDWLMKRSVS